MAIDTIATGLTDNRTTDTDNRATDKDVAVPGPRNIPYVGQALSFWRDPLGYTVSLARKYGDLTLYHIRGRPVYMLGHPDYVRYVFDQNATNYRKSDFYDAVRPFFGNGLGLSEGDFWKRQRQTMQPAFHRERIIGMAETMSTRGSVLAREWESKAEEGEEVDVLNGMMAAALNIATQSLFGVNSESVFDRIAWALPTVLRGAEKRVWSLLPISYKLPTPSNREFKRAIKELDDIVLGVIRERRQSSDHEHMDLLEMLLEARDVDGNGLNDQQLRDEVLTIFIAGFETVSSAMTFALDLLARHPEVQEKVHEELDRVLGDSPPSFENSRELKYLSKVFQEAMRLYPPVWTVSRAPLEDDVIGGHKIPKGATIQLSPYLMHRDPRWWEKADEFYPEHFNEEAEKVRPRYAYMPFGGGPRLCLGKNFALMEGPIVLGAVLQNLRVKPGSKPIEPEAMISMRPKGEAWLKMEHRNGV